MNNLFHVFVTFLIWWSFDTTRSSTRNFNSVVASAVLVGVDENDLPSDGDDDAVVVVLEDFCNPTHTWEEMNDPVMGGKSIGSFIIDTNQCIGSFIGQVVDVPFLHAPGFIQSRTTDENVPYPNVNHCTALQVHCTSHTSYNGYRISFGTAHPKGGKFFAYGYKANLIVDHHQKTTEEDNKVQVITIPFTNFTDFWDDATGDPIHTCQDNVEYCPDEFTLANMKRMAIWAEGVGGDVALDVYKIVAVGCNNARR